MKSEYRLDPEAIRANVPAELRAQSQWVAWRYVTRAGKATKVPVDPSTLGNAKTNAPETWAPFEEALAACDRDRSLAGIGFVFAAEDGFAGVDLDGCIDEAGVLAPWACRIIERIPGYAERSPSGRGVKVFAVSSAPLAHCGQRRGYPVPGSAVEAYDRLRFFTVTGQILGSPCDGPLPDAAGPLANLVDELWPETSPARPQSPGPALLVEETDREIIEKACAARNGWEFRRLWEGDVDDHGSQSEADLALCSHLAFWTGGDVDRMDRLFRCSGLFREKWERKDYRESTLRRALKGTAARTTGLHGCEMRQAAPSGQPTAPTPPERSGDGRRRPSAAKPVLVRMAGIKPEHPRFLGEGHAILGNLTVIGGVPGQGKSLVLIALASAVTTGRPFLPRERPCQKGSVLLLTAEDSHEEIARRLHAAGADVERVACLTLVEAGDGTRRGVSLRDVPAIEEAMDQLGDVLLVGIDPISAFWDSSDSHKDTEVRGLLAALIEMAGRRGIALVAIAHHRKTQAGHADYQIGGSVAIPAAARIVKHVFPDKTDKQRRYLASGKSNVGAPAPSWAFTICDRGDGPAVEWIGPVDGDANTFLAEAAAPAPPAPKRISAETWLRDRLASGPVCAGHLKEEGRRAGYSERTLDRARQTIGVTNSKNGMGGAWYWSLGQNEGLTPSGENDEESPWLQKTPRRRQASTFEHSFEGATEDGGSPWLQKAPVHSPLGDGAFGGDLPPNLRLYHDEEGRPHEVWLVSTDSTVGLHLRAFGLTALPVPGHPWRECDAPVGILPDDVIDRLVAACPDGLQPPDEALLAQRDAIASRAQAPTNGRRRLVL